MRRHLPFLAALALSACAVGPDYRLPDQAAINDPAAQGGFVSAQGASVSADALPARWWQLYDDARLNQLEAEALAANRDLRIAAANLARAQATQRNVEGAQDVEIGASFAGERAQLSGQSYLVSEQLPVEYLGNGGVKIAYQLDLVIPPDAKGLHK